MGSKIQFLKTTLIGGLVFLVPVIVLVAVVGKALELMKLAAVPLAAFVPVDSVAGIAIANLLAAVGILLLCFLAGLAARTRLAARVVEGIESGFLMKIPTYTFVKGMTASFSSAEGETELAPVLAKFDDAWQVAFEVERQPGRKVAVYVPGAPNPWSGGVFLMDEERIERLEIPMAAAIQNVRRLGRGSNALLGKESQP